MRSHVSRALRLRYVNIASLLLLTFLFLRWMSPMLLASELGPSIVEVL